MCCQDEATSALDAESEHLVQTALDALMVSRSHVTVYVSRLLSCTHDDPIALRLDDPDGHVRHEDTLLQTPKSHESK